VKSNDRAAATISKTRRFHPWAVLVAALAVAAWSSPGVLAATGPARPAPTVSTPPAGIHGFPFQLGCCYYNFGDVGYTLQEYFVSGTAKTYGVTPQTTAPYTTRVLVARPTDPAKFNGTALVEWENVTAQAPAEPDMVWMHHYMLPNGYAYVAVSAQAAGVQVLQAWDPLRYASLSHPGDNYSYDIFSQAGEAVKHPNPTGISPMGQLHVKRVIGIGQSQSAGRLNSYMNLAQNDADVYDGMIIQADGGSQKSFPDLHIPLVQFETQDSIVPTAPDRANSPQLYRLWEVPGAAHVGDEETESPGEPTLPLALTVGTQIPWSVDSQFWEHSHYGEEGPSEGATCAGGTEFPVRYALDAALADMNDSLTSGTAIPQPPRATFSSGSLALDQYGNGEGGVSLPVIQVPVSTYKATTCNLLGINVPLSPATLLQLYPTHDVYTTEMAAAITTAVNERIMVPSDGAELLAKAQRSLIPLWKPSTGYGIPGDVNNLAGGL
jgi:hypothetical protein